MVILKFNILLICFGIVREIKSSYLEHMSEEYDENSSLNSLSYEAFNISSSENKIDSDDASEIDNENLHINKIIVTTKPTSITTLKPQATVKEHRISKVVNHTVNSKSLVNYPFSVSIQKKSSHYASGALVDRQWVLTSAEEFYNVRESIKLFKARLGSVNCKRGGVVIPIKWVEIHPSYVHKKPDYDLALLRLATQVGYSELVMPIAISKISGRVISAKFLSTYWPRLIVKGQVLPPSAVERFKQNSMRVSTQKLIPKDICVKMMQKNNVTLQRSTLCLEPISSHHTLCTPDPGAPVVAKDGLWGIKSAWTGKRCSISSPNLFTRLSSPQVLSWLQLLLVDI